MTVVNNPYIAIIVGVCSIVGRNLSLYGVIRVVKSGGCGVEGVCGCDGGTVVVVEVVCVAVMVVRWCSGGCVFGCNGGGGGEGGCRVNPAAV